MDQDNDSLIGEGKAACVRKERDPLIHYFPSAGRCPATFWKAVPQYTLTVAWKDKYHNHKHCPFLLLPEFSLQSTIPYGMEYLFGKLGPAVKVVSPPKLTPPVWGREGGKSKSLDTVQEWFGKIQNIGMLSTPV